MKRNQVQVRRIALVLSVVLVVVFLAGCTSKAVEEPESKEGNTLLTKGLLKYWDSVAKDDESRLAEQTPTKGLHEEVNIPYIENAGEHQKLDIYYPEGTTGKLPVIMNIHGGGFMYGTKELNKYYNLYVASLGFTVVSISYRLVPEVFIGGQIKDVLDAMKWLEENGKDYPCDMENVFVTGDSAGGFHAVMGTLVQRSKHLQDAFQTADPKLNIRAVGMICPLLDLSSKPTSLMNSTLFGKGWKNKEDYKSTLIYDGFKLLDYPFPPSYIVTSEEDLPMVRKDALFMAEFLGENDVDHQLHVWEKSTHEDRSFQHVFPVLYPAWPESIQTTDEMVEFFKKNMV